MHDRVHLRAFVARTARRPPASRHVHCKPDRVSLSTRPAPEWASRTLFAFVVLSLAALIAIPWATDRRLRPEQDETNMLADTGRSLMTQVHFNMAQEGSAIDDYVIDDRDTVALRRFHDAATKKRAA